MIPNDALINALRSLGYEFKKQAPRVMVYKRRGNTQRVMVRRNSSHDEQYARILLGQAGMPQDEVEKFIAEARR